MKDKRTFEERIAECNGDSLRELCVLYQMHAEQLMETGDRQQQLAERLSAAIEDKG